MVMKTEAIKNFLLASTHSDLASMYSHDMEVQVNVARMGGEKTDGNYEGIKWCGWTDGFTTWKPFRIPFNAATEPNYTDTELRYDLAKYAEGIGLTGWDWKSQVSRWVAYDFDAITGHSEKHQKKLSEQELNEVRTSVSSIPWVCVRSSTSGSGLHLYVMLDPVVPTKTHTEHAALARSILGLMSALSGQNLEAKIDACGQNMWVWHRKMIGTTGLSVLKSGIPLDKIPENWREHLDVVSGKRRRVVPKFVQDAVAADDNDFERLFEELTGQRSRIRLDNKHVELIKYLETLDYTTWWDQDNHMLVAHTFALQMAHRDLRLDGYYETISSGAEPEQNCFCYPMSNGGWVVRRYTRGVAEAKCWDQDKNGMTRCYLNRPPNLKTLAKHNDAIEHPQGGYVFNELGTAGRAMQQLGVDINVPAFAEARTVKVKENKDGKLILEMEHQSTDKPDQLKEWLLEKGKWKRVVEPKVVPASESDLSNHDDVVRHLVSEGNIDSGWMINTHKEWRNEPIRHVSLALEALGLDRQEINSIEGASILNCWKLVNRPFQPEYPGNREWNRDAVQFKFPPTVEKDNLRYPTWNSILNHCGSSLDPYMEQNDWARENGITTGGEYLKCWVASVFQHPTEPLPYLFFYSKEQNTGKSTFHEALKELVTHGVMSADNALSDTQFNGELANTIIAYIEETDLKRSKTASNKIKDWTTSRTITISKKYETPYSIVNTLHFIQTANDITYVYVSPGDTRITMIHVPPLAPEMLIPKRDLFKSLIKEAPDFLAAVLSLELPPCPDRLNIPVILTSDKEAMEESNRSELDEFMKENCKPAPGYSIPLGEFFTKFIESLDPERVGEWTKQRVSKEIDHNKFPKGRNPKDCQYHYGNIAWKDELIEERPMLKVYQEKLISKGK